ncbi:MAG: hypothetical protein ACREDM_01300 [Methylocella sp.]
MTTAHWALAVSLLSLVVAMASFVWNVWSKFIYPKAKLNLEIRVMEIVPNPTNIPPFVVMSATNHGPTDVTLHSAIWGKRKKLFRRRRVGIIIPAQNILSSNPSAGPFTPKKLAIGEKFSVHFPILKQWQDDGLVKFGFHDLYLRNHWCSAKSTRSFLKQFDDELQKRLQKL